MPTLTVNLSLFILAALARNESDYHATSQLLMAMSAVLGLHGIVWGADMQRMFQDALPEERRQT